MPPDWRNLDFPTNDDDPMTSPPKTPETGHELRETDFRDYTGHEI
jgi:hypothetical protein